MNVIVPVTDLISISDVKFTNIQTIPVEIQTSTVSEMIKDWFDTLQDNSHFDNCTGTSVLAQLAFPFYTTPFGRSDLFRLLTATERVQDQGESTLK